MTALASFRRAALRAALLGSLSASAVAGVYQGYTYTSDGGAVAVNVDTKLTVLGIDSSGNRGVTIDLTSYGSGPAVGSWSLGLDTDSLNLAPGQWIEVKTLGTIASAPDVLVARERITGLSGGGVSILVDETPLAPVSTTTIATRACVRVSTTTNSGAILSSGAVVVPNAPRVLTFAASALSGSAAGINVVNAWSNGVANWLAAASPALDRAVISSTATTVPTAYTKIQIRASGVSQVTLTSLLGKGVGAVCEPRLIITKVIDSPLSDGTPDWVEITNVGPSGVPLLGYSLGHFPNGSASLSGGTAVALNAFTLPAGQSYVFAYEPPSASGPHSFQTLYGIPPNQAFVDSTPITGTSAFVLFKGTATGAGGDAELVDRYGTPGAALNPAVNSPPNFVRGYSGRTTNNPSTDFLESQWQFAGLDSLWLGNDGSSASLMSLSTAPGDYQGCGAGTPGLFCSGDPGSACPCGNFSNGGGCLHSFSSPDGFGYQYGGVLSAGQYTPSVATDFAGLGGSPLDLLGTRMPPTVTCLYFQGTSKLGGGAGVSFGDGLRCVGGAVLRLGIKFNLQGAEGGTSTYGASSGDSPVSIRGLIPPQGATRHYQIWYRNAAVFCTNSTFNLSNAITVRWVP